MSQKYLYLGGQSKEYIWDDSHPLDSYGVYTNGRMGVEAQPGGSNDIASVKDAVSFYNYIEVTLNASVGLVTSVQGSLLLILNNTSGGEVSIGGIDFSEYNYIPRMLLIQCLGDNINVKHADTSVANNQFRFDIEGSRDYLIQPEETCIAYYDQKALRWRIQPLAPVTPSRVERITSNVTLSNAHHKIFADTSSAAITVSLPAGLSGKEYQIINTGNAGNNVTITPNGSEQIFKGGAGVSYTLADSEGITITFESTEGWF